MIVLLVFASKTGAPLNLKKEQARDRTLLRIIVLACLHKFVEPLVTYPLKVNVSVPLMESAFSVPTLTKIVRSSWLTVTGSSSFGHIPVSNGVSDNGVRNGGVMSLETHETAYWVEGNHQVAITKNVQSHVAMV